MLAVYFQFKCESEFFCRFSARAFGPDGAENEALTAALRLYRLRPAAMDYPVYPDHDEDILTDEPGLMPDILEPLEESSGMLRLSDRPASVLLSLDTPLHGYGIMQNVESLSGGRVRLAAGTLYGALATLTERGWIVSLGDESEGRKKEYQITPAGREAVRAELRRLHELTQNGDKLTENWN